MFYIILTICGSILSTLLFTYFFHLINNWYDFYIPILIFVGSWIVFTILSYLLFALFCMFFKKVEKGKFPEKYSSFGAWVVRNSAWFYMFSTGYFYKIKGKEKIPHDRRYMIVSNHVGANDPIIYMAGMPGEKVGWICKNEIMEYPFVGRLLNSVLFLPLERDNLRQEVKVIKKAQEYLNNDMCSIGIYPEGTRNKTKETLLPFKAGAFKIATATKCPVVVSCITYNYPRGTKHKPLIKIATINILRVIEPSEYESLDTNALSDMVKEEIRNFLTAKK